MTSRGLAIALAGALAGTLSLLPGVAVAADGKSIDVETASAKLSKESVPATGRQEALLDVARFGRFAVTAESAQGTAVQVVSRMSGPGPVHGAAGAANGRVDTFLDRGQYKVVAFSDERGSGDAKVAVHSFEELHAPEPPALVEFKPFSAGLDDFQQISFWVRIDERRSVELEAAGRNLADLRLWKDGIWLVDREPEITTVQPVVGRPLTVARLWTTLEPGLYLLTAYGGPSQPWAEQSNEHPFHLRFGIPRAGSHARARHVVSEFGYDRYLVPGGTNYFRLELPEAKPATIDVGAWNAGNPFHASGAAASIEKNSVPPAAELRFGSGSGTYTLVTVTAAAGQPYVLQHFYASWHYSFDTPGAYWVSTVHSGPPNDSVDATAIVARTQYDDEDYRVIAYASETVEIGSRQGWKRRFNLLDTVTLFLDVKSAGTYRVEIEGEGVSGAAKIEPFFAHRPPRGYKSPKAQDGGGKHDLDAGLHVLTVIPDKKGIATVTVRPEGGWFGGALVSIEDGSPRAQVRFPRLQLDRDRGYGVWLNRQPGVVAGIDVRHIPLDLSDPLALATRGGEEVVVPFKTDEDGTVRATAEDGSALEVSVDGGAWAPSVKVKRGRHEVKARHARKETVAFSLGFEPDRLQKWTPLPSLPDTAKNLLPDFPVLSEKDPIHMDIERGQKTSFRVRADAPSLYRLESTGLLATAGNLRTRTIPSFDRASANGVGRNFLLQQYLREGDYQLTVTTEGRSQGRMGLALNRTRMIDAGTLQDAIPARTFAPAGDAVVYRFTIEEPGEYLLETLGLNRTFRARLEDADGWPLVAPNGPARFQRRFEKGSYRLVILPEAVDARQVTRLVRVREKERRDGHGPHALPLGELVEHVWTEPVAGGVRVPDVWTFELPAATDVSITLTAEMQGTLVFAGGGRTGQAALIPPERGWSGRLEAGSYRLEAVCSRVNNQVTYTVGVQPEALLPGLSRVVRPPLEVPVAVGRAGLAELASFGATDVRARLLTKAGVELASNDDRPGDWNFHIARPLAAGEYVLAVDRVGYGSGPVTVSMDVPVEAVQPALELPARRTVEPGRSVFVHPLTNPVKEGLLLVSARSVESVGVALERKTGDGWTAMGAHVGREARLEVPIEGAGPYRLRVWSVDRRGNPIELAAAAIAVRPSSSERKVSLERVPGMKDRAAGAVRLSRPGVVRLEDDGRGMRASVGVFLPAVPSPDGLVALPGRVLWLVTEGVKPETSVSIDRVTVKEDEGEGLALRMPPEGRLTVDLPRGKGPVIAVVRARRGQPGAQVADADAAFRGGPMEPAPRAAVAAALSADDPIATVWAATPGGEALDEVRVRAFAFGRPADGGTVSGVAEDAIEPGGARTFSLPEGARRVRVSGGNGIVVLVHDQTLSSVHGGTAAVLDETLRLTGGENVTVLSIAGDRQRFRIEAVPLDRGQGFLSVSESAPIERADTASGTLRLQVSGGSTPGVLRVRGASSDPVVWFSDGRVAIGRDVRIEAQVTGTVLVPHEPGWVLAFVEPEGRAAAGLWGDARELDEARVTPPATRALGGAVAGFRVEPDRPSVLHLRSATPAAVRIIRGDGVAPEVEIFPRGVVLDAYLPGGTADIALRPLGGGTLTGTLELRLSPVTPVGEGLGPEVLLPPGGTRVFSFVVPKAGDVGIGVRADSDVVEATLLDAAGKALGTGVVQMRELAAGTYLLALHVAEDAEPARVRPAVVGLKKPDTGPPPDVVQRYLEEAGVKRTSEVSP